jgi:hypothetical protein
LVLAQFLFKSRPPRKTPLEKSRGVSLIWSAARVAERTGVPKTVLTRLSTTTQEPMPVDLDHLPSFELKGKVLHLERVGHDEGALAGQPAVIIAD